MKNNMTERQGIYADHFSCTFKDPNEFLSFLRERKQNSSWMTVPSKNIQFQSIEADSPYGNLYMRIYQNNGLAEVLADTQATVTNITHAANPDICSDLPVYRIFPVLQRPACL